MSWYQYEPTRAVDWMDSLHVTKKSTRVCQRASSKATAQKAEDEESGPVGSEGAGDLKDKVSEKGDDKHWSATDVFTCWCPQERTYNEIRLVDAFSRQASSREYYGVIECSSPTQ